MDLLVKERSKDSITLVFRGIDIAFLNLLSYELLSDPRVLNAYAKKPHPLLEDVEFYVLVKENTSVEELLKEKINMIKGSFLVLKEKFEKELEEFHKNRS